jgi:hypothetical protein
MVSVRDAVKRAQWQPSLRPPLGMGFAKQSSGKAVCHRHQNFSGRTPISTCPPQPFMKAQRVSPALGKLSGTLLEFKLFGFASSNECKQVLICHWGISTNRGHGSELRGEFSPFDAGRYSPPLASTSAIPLAKSPVPVLV